MAILISDVCGPNSIVMPFDNFNEQNQMYLCSKVGSIRAQFLFPS